MDGDLADAQHFDALDREFERAVREATTGADRITLLFSGGIDSSLLALELTRLELPMEWVTLSLPGATDGTDARDGARLLGGPLRVSQPGPEPLRGAIASNDRLLGELPEPARSVQLALRLALEATVDARVLVGQGADELFGGYAHFRGLEPREAHTRRELDLARLREHDWPDARAIARSMARDLRAPYLDGAFVVAALRVPLEPVTVARPTKPFLRRWARHRGLPEALVQRPKKALQYGSGVAKARRAHSTVGGPDPTLLGGAGAPAPPAERR